MGYYEGSVLNDYLEGSAEDDEFEGLGGNDTLYGLGGDDLMDGGTGDDAMYGGIDNDTYYVHSANDHVYEYAGGGNDLIWTLVEYTLPAHVEYLNLFESAGAITAYGNNLDNGINGNSSANTLYGWGGNDIINGGLGNDTMLGGIGDDNYFADNANDVVVEALNSGTDTVFAATSYSIAARANVENLTLMSFAVNGTATGNNLANVIIGNATANTLVGNGGNDILDGGVGNDVMTGGEGNDEYYRRDGGDSIVELANQGADTIHAALTTTLPNHVEILRLDLTNASIDGTGNGLNNTLVGNAGENLLQGLGGIDLLYGEGGEDTLEGGSGGDLLDGGAGIDWMDGGSGDDYIVVDNESDDVIGGTGLDTVIADISYQIGVDVENLVLDAAGAVVGVGNFAANQLSGNSYNNILAGMGGNDLLLGHGGDDYAAFIGNRADYAVAILANGDVTVTDLRPGTPDGTDTLREMELIAFLDGEVAPVAPLGDVVWRHTEGMVAVGQTVITTVEPSYGLVTGDFDADGDADIMWRHEENGDVGTWSMEGDAFAGVNLNYASVSNSYQVVGTGDFDGDGDDDILWRHEDGDVVTWEMQDAAFVDSHGIESPRTATRSKASAISTTMATTTSCGVTRTATW